MRRNLKTCTGKRSPPGVSCTFRNIGGVSNDVNNSIDLQMAMLYFIIFIFGGGARTSNRLYYAGLPLNIPNSKRFQMCKSKVVKAVRHSSMEAHVAPRRFFCSSSNLAPNMRRFRGCRKGRPHLCAVLIRDFTPDWFRNRCVTVEASVSWRCACARQTKKQKKEAEELVLGLFVAVFKYGRYVYLLRHFRSIRRRGRVANFFQRERSPLTFFSSFCLERFVLRRWSE
jgi:hypothetical protein